MCILDFIGNNVEAIIAISALGLATWQGLAQRKHNQLSVKPHLVLERTVNNLSPQVTIILSNNGTGPAIIKDFQIYLDGEAVTFFYENTWGDIAKQLNIKVKWGGGKWFNCGDAIQAGSSEKIFQVKTTEEGKDLEHDPKAIHDALLRVQIIIKYESVYGNKFVEKFNKT